MSYASSDPGAGTIAWGQVNRPGDVRSSAQYHANSWNRGALHMPVQIVEEPATALPEYSDVPIAFLVESRLCIELLGNGLGGVMLVEKKVDPPYVKDYDQAKGEGPTRWLKRWDTRNWVVLSAFEKAIRVGGAVVAWNTPGVDMLEGRDDLAVLWDIRVRPELRRRGIGSRLFAHAVAWATDRGCRTLKVETQNINVELPRFSGQCVVRLAEC